MHGRLEPLSFVKLRWLRLPLKTHQALASISVIVRLRCACTVVCSLHVSATIHFTLPVPAPSPVRFDSRALIAASERSVGASTARRTTARRAHYTAQLHSTCRDVTARLRACVVSHVCCLLFAVTELAAGQSEAVARALPSNEFLSMRAAFKVSARRVSAACVFILRIYCSFALAAPQCHSLPLFKRRE